MSKRFSLLYVLGLIALVVAPSAVTLTYYTMTDNPNWRPLAVTERSLKAYERATGTGDGVEIVAQVEWVPERPGEVSRAQLERAITKAFKAKGVDVYVSFTNGVERTRVTYVVGYSRIGPYTTSRAADGIAAAVDAYHMYVPASS